MEFKIKRSEWLYGEGSNRSYLHRVDDKKCCVGFYLEALGVDPNYLKKIGFATAYLLGNNLPRTALWLEKVTLNGNKLNSRVAEELYEANDQFYVNEKERESTIKDLFSKNGVTVVFED